MHKYTVWEKCSLVLSVAVHIFITKTLEGWC